MRKVTELIPFGKVEELVGKGDTTPGLSIVIEEPDRGVALINNVEGIYDIDESKPHRGFDQCFVRNLSRISLPADDQKPAYR